MDDDPLDDLPARRAPQPLLVLLGVCLGFAGLACFLAATYLGSPLGPLALLLGVAIMSIAATSFFYSSGQSIASPRSNRGIPMWGRGKPAEAIFNQVESNRGDTDGRKTDRLHHS